MYPTTETLLTYYPFPPPPPHTPRKVRERLAVVAGEPTLPDVAYTPPKATNKRPASSLTAAAAAVVAAEEAAKREKKVSTNSYQYTVAGDILLMISY